MRPISIFLLARSLEMGGAERQLVQLAIGLRRRGYSVQVGVFYKRGPLVEELERNDVPIADLGKKGRWDLLGFIFHTRQQVNRAKADVLYSYVAANLIGTAVRFLLPRLKLVWGIRASDMDLTRYDWAHRANYRVERAFSHFPDLIIANSEAGRSVAIANGFPAVRIKVVSNGIDTRHFRPDQKVRRVQRRRWRLSNDEIAIGVLGRLDPMKGQENFLRAAAIAIPRLPRLRFLCIGEGPDEVTLRRLCNELGIGAAVLFTHHADAAAALNGLDIACSPSFTEGFSNSIAEAMACGLPCVVTDVGDSARIVGDCGAVVPRANPEALANALIAQAKALGSHDAWQTRNRIVENFSLDQMVDRTVGFIEAL